MKRGSKILATAGALIALLALLLFHGIDWGSWNFRLPRIEAEAMRRKPASIPAPVARTAASVATDRKLPAFGQPWSAGTPTTTSNAPAIPEKRSPKDAEAAPPYWCFRTFYQGFPWMMNTDERNTGNAARSDSEYIWNGERSLRMDFAPIESMSKTTRAMLATQRNVLWQAIRATPYRGKRIVFRPYLRALPGATLSAFLRSWDGKTGSPQLAYDKSDPTKTPTVIWGGAWGNPRLLLDVPMDAEIIYYGIVQSRGLPVWIDHVELEADPVPGAAGASAYQGDMGRHLEGLPPLPIDPNWVWKKPENLDFEIVFPDKDAEPLDDTPPLPC